MQIHHELNVNDVETAMRFYGNVFGWSFQPMTMGNGHVYTMIDGVGGLQKKPMPEAPSQWINYFTVKSIKDTATKIETGGGRMIEPYIPIEDMGACAICSDPDGAVFALFEYAPGKEPPPPAPAKAAAPRKKAAKKKAAKKAAPKKAAKKAAPKKAAKKAAKKPAKKAAKKKGKR